MYLRSRIVYAYKDCPNKAMMRYTGYALQGFSRRKNSRNRLIIYLNNFLKVPSSSFPLRSFPIIIPSGSSRKLAGTA